ncbi:hypothetical protein, partial [uncultured Gimesia sp.]|uniref:hypothetical protein n=1 Tax=uncultured Gimesia sp. TaxID=1678688 RepID=UPI002614D92E
MAPFVRKHEEWLISYTDSIATMMKRKNTISNETRQILLELIHDSVHTGAAPSEIEAAVTTLAELKQPESIPVLKRAAKLPNYLAGCPEMKSSGIAIKPGN